MTNQNLVRVRVERFFSDTHGTATVEAVLWLPIFMFILALVTDAALIYSSQSQAMRIVQDANRSMSVGRLRSIEDTEAFILLHLATISPNASVETVVNDGVIISHVEMPVTDLSATRMIPGFADLRVGVTAQHVSEI